jgi:hypothetical protein
MSLDEYINPVEHMYLYFENRKKIYEEWWYFRWRPNDHQEGYKVILDGLKEYSKLRIEMRNEWLRKKLNNEFDSIKTHTF